jgi:Protein of unknown function (DUF2868)
MHEEALRKVLLIQAIEETDRSGEALPLTERVEATRTVMGNNPAGSEAQAEASLSSASEWFLIRRAEVLLRSLRTRSPGIDHVLRVAGGVTALDRGVLVLAFALGIILSLLDGGRGINIFAPPLIVLIAWNLLAYLLMLGRTRPSGAALSSAARPANPTASTALPAMSSVRPTWFGRFYARWVRQRLESLLGHSTRFNAPLAPGLRRFAADWFDIAQPLFFLRARRLLHLAAALTAVGLIAGYYVRAFVLRSAAGWEGGRFVVAEAAHALLTGLYGPASLLSAIPIPTAQEIAKLRWSAPSLPGVGEPATWVHLIAWTAALYIVLPRLIATGLTTLSLWRLSRRLTLPPGVAGYVRTLLAAARYGPQP